MSRKKRIKKVEKSDLIPNQYNDVYENDLKELEDKIESEKKMIKQVISNSYLSKVNIDTFIYK